MTMAALQVSIPCALTSRKRHFDEADQSGRSSPLCIMRARVDSGHEPTSTEKSWSGTSPARKIIIKSQRDPSVISLADLDSIFGDFDFLPLPLRDENNSSTSTFMLPRPTGEVSSVVPANDDAAVSAFLDSDEAAWNQLVPIGKKVPLFAVIKAAKTLNFPANSNMISSLETLQCKTHRHVEDIDATLQRR